MTQEVVLKHHASISELKRIFMEDVPVSAPTEWDKRLSTHSPVRIPQTTNGQFHVAMDTVSVMLLISHEFHALREKKTGHCSGTQGYTLYPYTLSYRLVPLIVT